MDNIQPMRRCTKCNVKLPLEAFAKHRNGEIKKMCEYCLERYKSYYKTKKCLHGGYIYNCKTCMEIKKQMSSPS